MRIDFFSKVFLFLLNYFLFFLPLSLVFAQTTYIPHRKISAKLLEKDFEIFHQILEEYHPSLFTYLNENEWVVLKNKVKKEIETPKTEWEFYRLLANMTAQIRCEHTVLRISQNSYQYLTQQSEGLFPFEVKIIEGKLYIFRNLSDVPIIEGAEIVRINNEDTQSIISFLSQHVSADGMVELSKWYELSTYFSMFYAVLKGEKESFKIQFKDSEINELREYIVQGISYNIFQERKWKRYPEYYLSKKQKKELAKGVSILRLKDFEEKREWKKFFKYLSVNQIDKLIIDLRSNKGGLSDEAKKLLQFLIPSEINEPFLFLAKNQEISFDSLVHINSLQKKYSYKFIKKSFLLSDSLEAKRKQEKLKPHKYSFRGKLAILVNGNTSSAAVQVAATLHHRLW
ncbi:MAG: S41 family peptidase [Flammeovirgaceae bacterium]